VPASAGGHLATVVRATTLGWAWLNATRAVLDEGHRAVYDGLPMIELGLLDLVVDDPGVPDGLIERFGDPERIAWMHANFDDRRRVDELGGADSYATRLYDYAGSGRDQVAWVTDRLRTDPGTRSAIVTTLQPLTDSSYIPCVSLLQFWMPDEDRLELIVTAHSIDLGTKGYANLAELAAIQQHVAAELGVVGGPLVLRITSAHVYDRDLSLVRGILDAAREVRQR
jgi:thymidylate synthase